MGGVKTLLTAEEFLAMPPQEGKRFELVEGELIELTFPAYDHNDIIGNIYTLLRTFAKSRRLGKAFPSDCGLKLSPMTVRGPDVVFFRQESLARLDRRSNSFDGAADLIVEVVSPSDTVREMRRKVDQYLKAGAHTVWVVHPDSREVDVFTADGAVRRLKAYDALEAPDLLPGFSVVVNDLFEE